jgi:hypothetical protein
MVLVVGWCWVGGKNQQHYFKLSSSSFLSALWLCYPTIGWDTMACEKTNQVVCLGVFENTMEKVGVV